jgi:hypothetical protein
VRIELEHIKGANAEQLADLFKKAANVGQRDQDPQAAYRGIPGYPKLDLDLEGKSFVVHGPNGSGKYADIVEIVTEYVRRLPANERDAVLGDTCARVYRIPRQS